MRARPPLRVAVIHYWLVAMRGGERVLERVLRLFPEADLYTHVYDPNAVSEEIRGRRPKTTFINRLPASRRLYQRYLPLMPLALEELDLRGYDLVLSFEAGPAKGVIAPVDALHVCYCHSPMRYIWDAYPEYRASAGAAARASMPLFFPYLRTWDHASAARVDGFMANSSFVQRRIRRAWRRDSVVVHPPVPVDRLAPSPGPKDFFLWVSQMTPYKRADIAVDAFNALGLPLVMVGRGPMSAAVARRAKSNITIIPHASWSELARLYAECRALVFTAEEDFGIVPVEVMAAGRPVIAFGRGGVRDSVVPNVTGLFFDEQTPEALAAAVTRFSDWVRAFDPTAARRQSERFSAEAFDRNYLEALRTFAADHPRISDALNDVPVRGAAA